MKGILLEFVVIQTFFAKKRLGNSKFQLPQICAKEHYANHDVDERVSFKGNVEIAMTITVNGVNSVQ